MKKSFINIISVFLISVCLVGCKKSDKKSSSLVPDIIADKYIVKDLHTEYSIVLPKEPKSKEVSAANELAHYLKEASGARFVVVPDNEVVKSSKYISLGNTSLFQEQFASYSFDQLNNKISSYFITTKDENIYIYSNPNERGEAITYGVYDFLHELVGFEYYASDEIFYENASTINLRGYRDFFIEPSFDGRAIGNYYLMYHQAACDSLRITNIYRGTEWASELYGHSQIKSFVRPNDLYDGVRTNLEAHPEWFTNKAATEYDTTNNQLCWSAGESLENYVAEKFEHYFEQYPDATYFMFGQEDNSNHFCHCEKCERAIREHAVNYAGLQIEFMNHVIAKTETWLQQHQPGRQVRYVVFAYYATKTAPAIQKGDKWVPANDQVIPNEKLYIFYAPITCNFAFPLDNNHFNSDTYLQLQQWNEVAGGHVIIYLYDVNFRYYFSNFYNFGTVKSMYQTCRDLGVTYMYTQGATDTVTGCFNDMREYVESKLMWNVEQSYEELAKDFIDHYYYEAAPQMYEYYQTIRDRLTEYHASKGDGGSIYTNIVNTDIYPYSVIRYFKNLFKEAMANISQYQQSNPEFYNTLKGRIMKEYLSVIYLNMTLAKAQVTEEEKIEMKEIFSYYTAYFEITKTNEGGSLIDIDTLFA